MKKKSFLYSALAVSAMAAALFTAACAATPAAPAPSSAPAAAAPVSNSRILVAYFSRVGNTDFPADVDASTSASIVLSGGERLGTTELLARDIAGETGGDLFAIRSVFKYPANFDDLVDQNHAELRENVLPALAAMPDLSGYDTVFVGYPVWANTIPRPVAAFLHEAELSGKTVIPFCTHDGYGKGKSFDEIRTLAAGATVADGLDVEATAVPGAGETVTRWLSTLPISQTPAQSETRILVDGRPVAVTWDDTALSREIRSHAPFSVTMVNWAGREYYGTVDFRPEETGEGKRNFENGDVTYCPRNNSLAIFYAQTDNPNLTMDVIRIGRVTEDLTLFHEAGKEIVVEVK